MGRREAARRPTSRRCRAGLVEPDYADPRPGRAALRVRRSALGTRPHWSRQLSRATRSRRPPRARARAQRPVSRQDVDALVQVRVECRARRCDQPNALVVSRTGLPKILTPSRVWHTRLDKSGRRRRRPVVQFDSDPGIGTHDRVPLSLSWSAGAARTRSAGASRK